MSQLDQVRGHMDVVQVLETITSVLEDRKADDTNNSNIADTNKEIVNTLRKWSGERTTFESAGPRNTFFQTDYGMLESSMTTYDDTIFYIDILKRRATR